MIQKVNVQYENQGNYTLPCITTKVENDLHYSGSPKIAPKRPEEIAKPGPKEKAIT